MLAFYVFVWMVLPHRMHMLTCQNKNKIMEIQSIGYYYSKVCVSAEVYTNTSDPKVGNGLLNRM